MSRLLEGKNILDLGHCISVCFGAFAIMAFYHILSRFFGTFFPLEEKCAVRICEGKLKVITWRKMLFVLVPQCEYLSNFLPLGLYEKHSRVYIRKNQFCVKIWNTSDDRKIHRFSHSVVLIIAPQLFMLSYYIESLLYFGRKEAVFSSPIRRHTSSDLLNYAYVIGLISVQWAKSAIYCYTVVK